MAIVTLNLSPTATGNLMVQLSNPVEALLDGSGGSITTTNGIVNVGAISVTVAPASANLYGAQSLSLSATVAGTSSNVIWTINPQVGTLSSTGLYTAPSTISINQTIVVTATSVADPTKSGSADIHLLPVAVTLSPSTISLQPWQSTEFIANVTNASNSAVIWSLSPAFGDISNGKYSAPRRIRKPESVTVTATSVADSTKSASAIVTLVPFPLRGHRKFPHGSEATRRRLWRWQMDCCAISYPDSIKPCPTGRPPLCALSNVRDESQSHRTDRLTIVRAHRNACPFGKPA